MFGKEWSKKTATCGEKFSRKCRRIPVEDQLSSWSEGLALVESVLDCRRQKISVNCSSPVLPQWPVQGFVVFNFSGVLDPIRG